MLLSLSIFYPFYYLLVNSLNMDVGVKWSFLVPSTPSLLYYKVVFRDDLLLTAFFVTVARTVVGIFVTILVTSTCGFALRKRGILFRNFYIALFTIPMFFGGGLIPTYLNFKMLGLLDNFLVFIVPRAFDLFFVIIFMTGFNALGDELEDSAKMDGAGFFKTYARIYFPLCLPIIAIIALRAGVNQWNQWFDSIFYTSNPKLRTMPAILVRIIRKYDYHIFNERTRDENTGITGLTNPEGIKLATMFVTIFPILFIYPFLQRYFIKGIMIGSLKG